MSLRGARAKLGNYFNKYRAARVRFLNLVRGLRFHEIHRYEQTATPQRPTLVCPSTHKGTFGPVCSWLFVGGTFTTSFADFDFFSCFVHAFLGRKFAPRPENPCKPSPISLCRSRYDMSELTPNPWVWWVTGWGAILCISAPGLRHVFTPSRDRYPRAPCR